MSEQIPDLMPDIRTDYESPYIVLQRQAAFLKKKTGGVLDGIVPRNDTADTIRVIFEVYATVPNIRDRVLTVTYKFARPYPAEVEFRDFDDVGEEAIRQVSVDTYEDLLTCLRKVFSSSWMNALFNSLIAKTNELRTPHMRYYRMLWVNS